MTAQKLKNYSNSLSNFIKCSIFLSALKVYDAR